MAVFISGQAYCPLCGKLIQNDSSVIIFPNFEGNTKSVLYKFSGNKVHKSCYENSPHKAAIDNRVRLFRQVEAQPKIDFITGQPLTIPYIGHPDNIIGTGFLTDDVDSPLYQFNNLFLNKKNLTQWQDLTRLIDLLREYDASGTWGGNALKNLIASLQSLPTPDISPALLARLRERNPARYENMMKSE
jgi:hypothetical protein